MVTRLRVLRNEEEGFGAHGQPGRVSTDWLSLLVLVSLGLILAGCAASSRGAEWREEQQRTGIVRAVLDDLAEMPPDKLDDSGRVICVAIGEDLGRPTRDPAPGVVHALRARRSAVFPVSECDGGPEGVRHKGDGAKAMLLGVGSPEWKDDEFVRVRGWRYLGPFAGTTWTYTLSWSQDKWDVVTTKVEKIS